MTDPLSLSSSYLRAWQDGYAARNQRTYEAGPTVYYFWREVAGSKQLIECSIAFPTFQKDTRQTATLIRAGFRWSGRHLSKRIRPEREQIELTAARRMYASLHPNWMLREGDTGVVHCTTQGESCPA